MRASFASAVIAGTVGTVVTKDNSGSTGGSAGTPGQSNHEGMVMSPATTTPASETTELSSAEMDAMHKQGIEDFLKNQKTPLTKGKGNQPLQATVENGVKVFRLTVDDVNWEVTPEKTAPSLGYNSMLPGPLLRATEGDTVRIIVKNNLKESTSVHWHGLYVPNNMDGVPYINQEPIKPGASFTYEFTLRNAGTHMYHSHHNSLDQVNRGLLGAFIVDPKDPASYPAYDREYLFVLNDLAHGFTINGKSFPATDAADGEEGREGADPLPQRRRDEPPVHLHGMAMRVFAKDGYPVNPPQMCDTLMSRRATATTSSSRRPRPAPGPSTATSFARRGAQGHVRPGDGADRRVSDAGSAFASSVRAVYTCDGLSARLQKRPL